MQNSGHDSSNPEREGFKFFAPHPKWIKGGYFNAFIRSRMLEFFKDVKILIELQWI